MTALRQRMLEDLRAQLRNRPVGLTANRISEIFGVRLNKRLNGNLATVIDQIEQVDGLTATRTVAQQARRTEAARQPRNVTRC